MLLPLIVAASSYALDSTQKKHWTESDYYKKSRRQRTWAWVSTGVGVSVLMMTLVAEGAAEVMTLGEAEGSGYTAPYLIGGACVATGVGLFIAAGENRRKARESVVFIDMERTPVLQQSDIRIRSYPAIGIRVNF